MCDGNFIRDVISSKIIKSYFKLYIYIGNNKLLINGYVCEM